LLHFVRVDVSSILGVRTRSLHSVEQRLGLFTHFQTDQRLDAISIVRVSELPAALRVDLGRQIVSEVLFFLLRQALQLLLE